MKTKVFFWVAFLASSALFGQTLIVGTGSGPVGSTIPLPLTMSGVSVDTLPAGLQWTVKYPKTVGVIPSEGQSATAANKYFHWVDVPTGTDFWSYNTTVVGVSMVQTAILSGLNANTMQNGVVAYLNVKLATGFSGSAPIAISGTLGATADGNAITIGGVNGGVSKGTVVNAHNITAHSSQSGGMPARAVGSPTDLKLDPLTLTPEIRRAECSSERLQEIGDKAICTLTFNSQFIGAEKIILEPYISHGSALEIEPKELVIVPGTESVDFTATLKRRLLPEEEVFSIGVKAPRGDVIQIFVWIGHEKPK